MPFVPIRNLGARGVNADKPPWELEANEFSAGENVRFSDGAASKTPKALSLESLAEKPEWGEVWIEGGVPQLAYASATKLYQRGGGTFADVSGAAYSASGDWQSWVWGEAVAFNNGIDTPQKKGPGDATFVDIPNWPADLRAKTVRAYKNFLVFVGITEAGTYNPSAVGWSTEAAPGEWPATYDPADTTALAGRNTIDLSAGELVDCLPLGNANILYTRTTAYAMRFVGGQFVFAFDKLFDQGIISRDAVASFDSYHLVVSPTDIYIHDGSTPRSIAHDRYVRTFFSELGDRDSVQCVANPKTKEVWIVYATEGSDYANKALVYNYQYNTFAPMTVPNSTCVLFGPKQGEVLTWDAMDTLGVSWSDLARNWGEFSSDSIYPVMYFLDAQEDALKEADYLYVGDQTERFFLERIGLDMDRLLNVPTKQWKYLRQIIPQIEGSGTVTITLGEANTPMGSVRWRQPQTFNIDTDYKLDTRIKARYLAYRIESNTPGYWRLTGWDFDLTPVDGR